MFYAKELLSMKSKTDISIIYYLSTTNNYKRISKNDIVKIDINSTLMNILNQTFALRLYGFLLRGVSKIYMLKIKYYENEVKSLLNVLKMPIENKTKNKQVSKRKYLNNCSSDMFENIYDGNACNNVSTEQMKLPQKVYLSNICDSLSELNDYKYLPSIINNKENNIKNKLIIDENIEVLSINRTKKIRKSRNLYKFIKIKEYPILQLLDKNKELMEVERNPLGSNVPSQILTDTASDIGMKNSRNLIDYTNMHEEGYEGFSDACYQPNDSSMTQPSLFVNWNDLLTDNSCFSKIAQGSRYSQALMFYELLDLCGKNKLSAIQNNPEDEIFVTKNVIIRTSK